MEKNKHFSVIMGILFVAFMASVSTVSATTCTDAGDLSDACTTVSGVFNGTMAVIGIVFSGTNASLIIKAGIVLAIVTAIFDLSRGGNSYLANKFRRM